jgi:acetolactate synthase-1/2/3 large subunit
LVEFVGLPPDRLEQDLAKALRTPGPSVVLLPAVLRMFAPTHLG